MRQIELSTSHEDISAGLDALASHVKRERVRAVATEQVDAGEWVRFRWTLSDGSPLWEGVGRCERCEPLGGAAFELDLRELTLDPRNEALHERILLVGEAGRATGAHQAVAPVERIPSEAPPPAEPKRTGYASAPTRASAKLSAPLRDALRPKPRSGDGWAAVPKAKAREVQVPAELVERAQQMVRRLKLGAPALARGRWDEQRVLEVALRMGLESLEGLLKTRDEL